MAFASRFSGQRKLHLLSFVMKSGYSVFFATGAFLTGSSAELEVSD